ncbi:hypothetical protein D3C78_1154860 [compost metagenome]
MAEFIAVERIERDIDAAHAAIGEFGGEFRKLRAVGGQRQFVERACLHMSAEVPHQRHDVLAHQRLAASQPQLAHAARDEDGTEAVEFFERQKVLLRQEGHVLGHAIGAAEIAAVGHGNA